MCLRVAGTGPPGPQPPQSRGTLKWSFSLRMALMVVTGSVSPACCCTVFSLREPNTRLQAAHHAHRPPRVLGTKRASRSWDVLKKCHSPQPACVLLTAESMRPSHPAGDPESRDADFPLASSTAQVAAPRDPQGPSAAYGSGLEGQKGPQSLARAQGKHPPSEKRCLSPRRGST